MLEENGAATAGGEIGLVVAGGGAKVSAGGAHRVQIVEVEVLVMVETVVIVCTKVVSPDVIVFVTGQVVRVVKTLYELVNCFPNIRRTALHFRSNNFLSRSRHRSRD